MSPKKERIHYVCSECGERSLRWFGRCPACEGWNTLAEEAVAPNTLSKRTAHGAVKSVQSQPLGASGAHEEERMALGESEIDRVLGGGIVPGSLILLGGEPGVGKSTLLLQLAAKFGDRHGRVLYVSGEESARQVALRATRLGLGEAAINVLCETRLEAVEAAIRNERPQLVIVDSVQTMIHPESDSGPGSVSQVRDCAALLATLAKSENISIFLVGHVNKQGSLAGPKVLEHAVDVVLEFDGERHTSFRLLRAQKNRFGSTHEVGLFEMGAKGLSPVANPSEFFLAERPEGSPGSVVVAAREGSRPILVEIQALVAPSAFGGTPRRQVSGADYNRVSIVLAVLERRVGLALQGQDVYINVAGGAKLAEPACDLAIAIATASSLLGKSLRPKTVLFGEVGLAGEVRSVSNPGDRLGEAARLGFSQAIVPAYKSAVLGARPDSTANLTIHGVQSVSEALQRAFEAPVTNHAGVNG